MYTYLFYLQNKYKSQYEQMKHRYTAIADTPLLIRAKKSYFQSSDVSQLVPIITIINKSYLIMIIIFNGLSEELHWN